MHWLCYYGKIKAFCKTDSNLSNECNSAIKFYLLKALRIPDVLHTEYIVQYCCIIQCWQLKEGRTFGK